MFVETYRTETLPGGAATQAVPYPIISEEDWKAWQAFLPVKTSAFPQPEWFSVQLRVPAEFMNPGYRAPLVRRHHEINLYHRFNIPLEAGAEISKAAKYFNSIEVWGKSNQADPIAVGLIGGRRYLITRWGPDALVPFEEIKSESKSFLNPPHNGRP